MYIEELNQRGEDNTAFCYYSTFPLFDDDINSDLIKKQRFVRKLLRYLGEEWKTYAGCCIYYELDENKHYLNWQYCFDYLIILWFDVANRQEDQLNDFINDVQVTFQASMIKFDIIYLRPVCEGFYLSSIQIWEKVILSRQSSSESLQDIINNNNKNYQMDEEQSQQRNSLENSYRFLKPMAVITGKIIQFLKQGSTGVPIQTKQQFGMKQIQNYCQIPQYQSPYGYQSIYQQQSQQQQKNSYQLISQIGERMLSQEIVQQAYLQMSKIFNKTNHKYQVAQQFVMMIIEINHSILKNIQDKSEYVNLRFLQPATGFYNNLVQIWILLRLPDENQEFQDFLKKVIVFLGDKWNDRYLYPTQFFYQKLFDLWQKIMLDPFMIQKPDEEVFTKNINIYQLKKVKILIELMKEQLLQVWENEIVQKMFNYQHQNYKPI